MTDRPFHPAQQAFFSVWRENVREQTLTRPAGWWPLGGRSLLARIMIDNVTATSELLERLPLDYPADSLLIGVNGRWARPDQLLHDGDQVSLIPAICGG